tara:strand:+ start:1811 stop:2149 length:339 start_codon:yes stop_codon:yes gene_type:complete
MSYTEDYEYTFYDKFVFGGFGHGTFCLPSNLVRVIFTILFPPLGVIFKFLKSDFPYLDFMALAENLSEVLYVFILTSLFYIPGLIYSLSIINKDTEIDDLIDEYNKNNRNKS